MNWVIYRITVRGNLYLYIKGRPYGSVDWTSNIDEAMPFVWAHAHLFKYFLEQIDKAQGDHESYYTEKRP